MDRDPRHGPPAGFEPRSAREATFLALTLDGIRDLDVWPRELPDGTPWLLLSVDHLVDHGIRAVPRLDFTGDTIRGAYSPASLNWDSELTAVEAGIDVSGPAGIELSGPVNQLAQAAIAWFAARAARWEFEIDTIPDVRPPIG